MSQLSVPASAEKGGKCLRTHGELRMLAATVALSDWVLLWQMGRTEHKWGM